MNWAVLYVFDGDTHECRSQRLPRVGSPGVTLAVFRSGRTATLLMAIHTSFFYYI